MAVNQTTYDIALLCDYPNWWRYNVYIIAVGYDDLGSRVGFNDMTNRVRELSYGDEQDPIPSDAKERKLSLQTDPCSYVEIYLYAVTNTFPSSTQIKNSPPFTVTLRTTVNSVEVDSTDFSVNQWGGLTVVAHRVGVR